MTRTSVSVDLHDTHCRAEARRVVSGKLPVFVANLRWESTDVELLGSLDDIGKLLDALQHDLACLKAQEDEERA